MTNTPANPACSTAVAVFDRDWALIQLWFRVAPIVGVALACVVCRWPGDPDPAMVKGRK
ncbi:MAG: hypothetical protein ABI859_10515 [Pseudomonadota bacterium]